MPFEAINLRSIMGTEQYLTFNNVSVESTNWIILDGHRALLPYVDYHIESVVGQKYTNCSKIRDGEQIDIYGWSGLPRVNVPLAFLIGGASNFFHFTIDHLANLFYRDCNPEIRYALPLVAANFPWQKQMTYSYRTAAPFIEALNRECIFEVETLIVPNKCFDPNSRILEPRYFDWLSEQTEHIPASPFEHELLYVSRSKARCRSVTNEDDLFEVLEKKGFIRVILEELPVIEQISLFKSAKCIVGPHGAGFTHLVNCTTGTKVIEFMPSQTWRPRCFEYISHGLGLDYNLLLCPGNFSDPNFSVDIGALTKLL